MIAPGTLHEVSLAGYLGPEEMFISSGASKQITMGPIKPLAKLTEWEESRLGEARCILSVPVFQYSGKKEDFRFQRGCAEFRELIDYAQKAFSTS
jgi:hypothetical protein